MKIKIIIITYTILSFISCKFDKEKKFENSQKSDYIFTVTGNVVDEGNKYYFLSKKEETTYQIIDTASVKNDVFLFNGEKKLPINIYYISTDQKEYFPVLIDNTDIIITTDKTNFSKSISLGVSDLQEQYTEYIKGANKAENLFNYQKQFIENNNNSILAGIILESMLGKTEWRLTQTKSIYETLDDKNKKSEIGQYILKYIIKGFEELESQTDDEELAADENTDIKKQETKPKVTMPKPVTTVATEYAPYFYAPSLDGNELSSKEIFNKNKVILIDFWASWCVPCRALNPDLVRLYSKYHHKGFEILSVSEDKSKDSWQSAVAQDNMTWIHVIDDYKRVALMYNVGAIPHAFVVDNQGGVIAKKVSIPNLERILKEKLGN